VGVSVEDALEEGMSGKNDKREFPVHYLLSRLENPQIHTREWVGEWRCRQIRVETAKKTLKMLRMETLKRDYQKRRSLLVMISPPEQQEN
jgi:hypothetical protein